MRLALALSIAGAAAWMPSPALAAAGVLPTTITVRVYQTAGLSSTLEQRALAEARTVLGAALVDVDWRRCYGPNPSRGCDAPAVPSELSLRIVRARSPRQHTSIALGDAVVDRRVGGVLATVYVERVGWLAKVTGTDAAVLLGRATAHELGHLLMRTAAHARRGLMRPNWTPDEVRRNMAADWAFTAGDVVAMHQPWPTFDLSATRTIWP